MALESAFVLIRCKLARHTVHLTNLSWTTLFTEASFFASTLIFNSKPMAFSAASMSIRRGVVLVLHPLIVASQIPVRRASSASLTPISCIWENRNFRNGLELVICFFKCISTFPYKRPHSLTFFLCHTPVIPDTDVEAVDQVVVTIFHLSPSSGQHHHPARHHPDFWAA